MDRDDLQVAETNATERVAFDLMEKIANKEALPKDSPRRYYLELYAQCLYVVKSGGMPQCVQEHPLPRKNGRPKATAMPRGRRKISQAELPSTHGEPPS